MKLAPTQLHRQVRRVKDTISPQTLAHKLQTRRIIQDFADSHGMVYFGYVNHRTDEHRLVRGMTTSTHQDDTHYCIGSFQGYDAIFVRRQSTMSSVPSKQIHRNWLIMQIDLRTNYDIPHVFIGPHVGQSGQYDEITSALHSFSPITIGVFGAHSQKFTNAYQMYTKPSRNIDVERILTPEITEQIAAHFSSLAIEIWDDCLFVYSTHRRPTRQLLDAMLRNGVWLAEQIDARCRHLIEEGKLIERSLKE